jgi:hypothetical protein
MKSDDTTIEMERSVKGQYGESTVSPVRARGSRNGMPTPAGARALVIVQFVMALIAIPSGIVLLADPSGSLMGGEFVLPHLKAAIPFLNDFTLIGIWLLVVFGLVPVVLALNLIRGNRWAWIATIVLGIVEVSWIAAELSMFYDLGFTPMYPLIGGIGAATLVIALLPSLRRYYSEKRGLGFKR